MDRYDHDEGDDMQGVDRGSGKRGVRLTRAEVLDWLQALEGTYWMFPWSRAMLSPVMVWLHSLLDIFGDGWNALEITIQRDNPPKSGGEFPPPVNPPS